MWTLALKFKNYASIIMNSLRYRSFVITSVDAELTMISLGANMALPYSPDCKRRLKRGRQLEVSPNPSRQYYEAR